MTADMPEPRMQEVDLTDLMNAGVLMFVNEVALWPLGLALTWNYDPETGRATNLHVTQWRFGDGHVEGIALERDDPTGLQRRAAFEAWLEHRLAQLPESDIVRAQDMLRWTAPLRDGSSDL